MRKRHDFDENRAARIFNDWNILKENHFNFELQNNLEKFITALNFNINNYPSYKLKELLKHDFEQFDTLLRHSYSALRYEDLDLNIGDLFLDYSIDKLSVYIGFIILKIFF